MGLTRQLARGIHSKSFRKIPSRQTRRGSLLLHVHGPTLTCRFTVWDDRDTTEFSNFFENFYLRSFGEIHNDKPPPTIRRVAVARQAPKQLDGTCRSLVPNTGPASWSLCFSLRSKSSCSFAPKAARGLSFSAAVTMARPRSVITWILRGFFGASTSVQLPNVTWANGDVPWQTSTCQ